MSKMNPQADVLIVTVTEVESKAVVETFQAATGYAPQPQFIGDRMYQDLGLVNGARVFIAQSEMGSVGQGASQQTVQKGIDALSPSAVIMVGIAFGINAEKQSIGDILISKQLRLYDLQRVGTSREGKLEIVPRGDRPHASARLLSCFKVAAQPQHWDASKAKVRVGLILSGEKLADNLDFRQQLLSFEQEAIGGEMEGAGLYVACHDSKVDWILVKAICDWGDGDKDKDKDERQKLAAHNAASFVLHALLQASLKTEAEHHTHVSPMRDLLPVAPPTGEAATASRDNRSSLPTQPYFFGREKELAIIKDALAPESRSWGVLIDGPGGMGKTALAIRAGHIAPVGHFPLKIFLSAKGRELTPAGEQPLQDFMLPNFMSLLSELARELGEEDIARTPPDERANTVRRVLTDKKQALIVIDNVETFDEKERVRLYQFLSRLPGTCKAIVTSRRRTDIDARIIRLDRLALKDALDLINELAKTNSHLSRADNKERQELYETSGGNPLIIKWVAGQLGRAGSNCRTIAEACAFMEAAPQDNDPLEFIFGDLLNTFTASETAVLAALTHFTQPAKIEWIAELSGLKHLAAQTALEDLADRALLVSDEVAQTFFLPPLAATFLRRKRPEAVAHTGNRLAARAYALVMENGHENFDQFPTLEAEWPTIAPALPLFLQGDNARLQSVCRALNLFLEFSGRWDGLLSLSLQAEERALSANDFNMAGWRAWMAGYVYHLRGQAVLVLACAARCEAYWQEANMGTGEKARATWLRGTGHKLERNYPAAIAAFKEALELLRLHAPESISVGRGLNSLASAEMASGDYASAERDYREALRIAKKINDQEGIASYTCNSTRIAIARQDWPAAEELARESLAISEALGRLELIGINCDILAEALLRQNKPQEALPYARRAIDIFTVLRQPARVKSAQATLQECESMSDE
ncbi:MAG TPA: tetratricopeptide repeat protein [Pyrinomonadaceae bacterium]|nr:tetratricopeptide repeat protein [Pyrinomonadaceae bacterium]